MTAFEHAYHAGADGIELDVRLSKDGEIVIFHDAKIDRMTDGTGAVNDYTLKELQSYPITQALQNDSKQQVIPTLSDYLTWAKDKPIITNIEIKSIKNNYRLELRVAEAIQTFKMEESIIVSTFLENSLTRIKILSPNVKTGLLLSEYDEQTVKSAKELGVDFIHLKADSLDPKFIESAHEHGLGVNVWTVNEIEDLEKVNKMDVHAIITDFPDRLKTIQPNR